MQRTEQALQTGPAAIARLSSTQVSTLRSYYGQVLGDLDQVRNLPPGAAGPQLQPALPQAAELFSSSGATAGSKPGVYEAVRADLYRGDLSFMPDLEGQEKIDVIRYFLDEQARLLEDAEPQERAAILMRLRPAFEFISQRGRTPGIEGPRFHHRERAAADQAVEGLNGDAAPEQVLQSALDGYLEHRDRHTPAGADQTLTRLQSDENANLHHLYWALYENSDTPKLPLNAQQRQDFMALMSARFDLGATGPGMARKMLGDLDPNFDDNRFADFLAGAIESKLNRDGSAPEDFVDSTGLKDLGEALKKADGASRNRLLAVIRKLYPHLHPQYQRALREGSEGRDVHGRFVLAGAAADSEIDTAYDRMSGDRVEVDTYRQSLDLLRRRQVGVGDLAPFYMDAYKASEGNSEFLDPLLDAPDDTDKSVTAIVDLVKSNDIYGGDYRGELQATQSRSLLKQLSQRRDNSVAGQATTRILDELADVSDSRRFSPEAVRDLTGTLATLPAGDATLKLALRLRSQTRDPELRATLDQVISASRDKFMEAATRQSSRQGLEPRLDSTLEWLGSRYHTAAREGRREEAAQLKGLLNDGVAAAGGLPEGDYLPESLGEAHIYQGNSPWTRRSGSYLRDYLESAQLLSPNRRQELLQRLGDLPQSDWKDSPLGFGERSLGDTRETNRYYDQMRDLRIERERLRSIPAEVERLEAEMDQLRQAHQGRLGAHQGLSGRMRAAAALEGGFDTLTAFSDAHRLEPRQFDALLMKAGGLAQRHPAAARRILEAGQGELKPEQLARLLELAGGLSAEQLKAVAESRDLEGLKGALGDGVLQRLQQHAEAGQRSSLFDREGNAPSRGDQMVRFLIDSGRSQDLFAKDELGDSLIDHLIRRSSTRDLSTRHAADDALSAVLADPERAGSNLGRQARLKQVHLTLARGRGNPDEMLATLNAVRRDPAQLSGSEKLEQLKLNLELSATAAEVLVNRKHADVNPYQAGQSGPARADFGRLLVQIEADLKAAEGFSEPEVVRAVQRLTQAKAAVEARTQQLSATDDDMQRRQRAIDRRTREIDEITEMDDPVARNRRITRSYAEISREMRDFIGADGGANWATWAAWASRQAGQTIRGEDAGGSFGRSLIRGALGPGLGPIIGGGLEGQVRASAAAVARGNNKVHDEIAREFVRFLETFRGDTEFNQEKLDAYLATFRPGPPERGGQDQLRQAFEAYYRAKFESNKDKKQELMLLGNARIGFHEQTRLQSDIEGALPGIGRGLATEWLMSLRLPGGSIDLGDDVESFRGREFPAELRDIDNAELLRLIRQLDANPDTLRGSGTDDWANFRQRMNFILDLFRSRHNDERLFENPE